MSPNTLDLLSRAALDTERLTEKVWNDVYEAGADSATYEAALAKAIAVVDECPGNPQYQSTLALARYRVGDYEEAETVVTEFKLEADIRTLAVLAMSHWRLGHHQRARDVLARVQEHKHFHDEGIGGEAVQLINGKPD